MLSRRDSFDMHFENRMRYYIHSIVEWKRNETGLHEHEDPGFNRTCIHVILRSEFLVP